MVAWCLSPGVLTWCWRGPEAWDCGANLVLGRLGFEAGLEAQSVRTCLECGAEGAIRCWVLLRQAQGQGKVQCSFPSPSPEQWAFLSMLCCLGVRLPLGERNLKLSYPFQWSVIISVLPARAVMSHLVSWALVKVVLHEDRCSNRGFCRGTSTEKSCSANLLPSCLSICYQQRMRTWTNLNVMLFHIAF